MLLRFFRLPKKVPKFNILTNEANIDFYARIESSHEYIDSCYFHMTIHLKNYVIKHTFRIDCT